MRFFNYRFGSAAAQSVDFVSDCHGAYPGYVPHGKERSKILMSTIATTIAGPKTYSAEELQALHLAMNAKAKRKKMLQKTALVTMNLIVCLFMLFPRFIPSV